MTNSGVNKPTLRRLRITVRDMEILAALHTARYLSTTQIEKLFWRESRGGNGRTKACQERLRLLYEHGLLRRIELPVQRGQQSKPYVYALDRRGADCLVTELGIEPGEIDWRPCSQEEHFPFMEHLLTTTDFRIALAQACAQAGVTLQAWVDEKELKSSQNVDYVTLLGTPGRQRQSGGGAGWLFYALPGRQVRDLLCGGRPPDRDDCPL